ncbi:putative lipoprotein transmembrane protein, partial [Cupriavidus basilensis OR16]
MIPAFLTLPAWRRGAAGLAAAALLAACASQTGASKHFDVDAFLRASDTALPEVLANPDFLAATQASANDCAVLLQSVSSGVLEGCRYGSERGPPGCCIRLA